MDGPSLGQHGADLTRSASLYQHGGAWIDVGNILIQHLDHICWDKLEKPDSPYRVAIPVTDGLVGGNNFIAARKHGSFIYQWSAFFLSPSVK